MKILVIGGTLFLSKTVAAEAVSRGHDVLCAARGASGRVPDGAGLVHVDRDTESAYDKLRGERFDAVVDVARTSVTWAREAVRALGQDAGHWTFVSSCSVYSDHSAPGRHETLDPIEDDPTAEFTSERYGAQKVAAENAVREALDDRAFILRAGLITGPGDPSDRFGYWPARMSDGGQVVVPDVPDQAAQHIDVRDLAAWIVDAAEQRLTGTFDGTGPSEPLGMLLGEIAGATAAQGTELVRVPEAVLDRANINPWAGPRSLPLWLPASHRAMMFRDAGPALAAGLKTRPVAETALDSLEYERGLGIDRPRKAGLTHAEEAEVLTAAG
ncbi:NAD-dependent epimerase/dehydratase family protein [Lentzea tibetensis]|uniref:NAD-dependent epimerase/dehydratase family protein n=1 Tax=Lentzea tibetensis TaxID=2591470 RepID=A0A563EZH3_9PSEU|nr:NAD-dependent epimerase/dehydratase family protein [Lentzea tibetensis]TWP53069.1 NAD-dependent epimerase/dehydratase family protein [Lentzea tibetensis]